MTGGNLDFLGSGIGGPAALYIGSGHLMVVGHTGRGKSSILQAEAARRGISYEELLKELEPTADQQEAARLRKQAAKEKVAKRLTAVCEAYWQSSGETEFYPLHDALVSTLMAGATTGPTSAQVKALFMMLPAKIIGFGIAWGFSDTEVRDDIYGFLRQNAEAVATQLGLTSPNA